MPTMFTIPDSLKKLLALPRFWLLVIGVGMGIYFYTQGQIDANKIAELIAGLCVFSIGALTLENAVASVNAAHVAMNAENAQAQIEVAHTQVTIAKLNAPSEGLTKND